MRRIRIAGVPVDTGTMEDFVARVAGAVDGDEPFPVLVTNANKAWLAARDPGLRAILDDARLAVPEYAMQWASRRLGEGEVSHIGGITLMARLLAEAERRGHTVYLLGATAEVLEAVIAAVRARHPDLVLAGSHHGYFDDTSWDEVVGEIEAVRPDLLFVAMGSPAQEYRIAELADRLPTLRVAMGVGGSFDVLAGRKSEAPGWARGSGLEWLYRLAQDPRRMWKRYLVTNTWFVGRVLADRWKARRSGAEAA